MSNSNNQPSLQPSAVFGVAVLPDGTLQPVIKGQFDAGMADQIAAALVLMAADIRAATRRRVFAAGK